MSAAVADSERLKQLAANAAARLAAATAAAVTAASVPQPLVDILAAAAEHVPAQGHVDGHVPPPAGERVGGGAGDAAGGERVQAAAVLVTASAFGGQGKVPKKLVRPYVALSVGTFPVW